MTGIKELSERVFGANDVNFKEPGDKHSLSDGLIYAGSHLRSHSLIPESSYKPAKNGYTLECKHW